MRGPRKAMLISCLLVATLALQTDASFDRFLLRRQAGDQESTTPKSATQEAPPQQPQTPQVNNEGRLYPDLPQRPNFIPPFNAHPHHVNAPFVPFGMQVPGGGLPHLNADQQPAPFGRMPQQPRPMTAAERLQSQTFTGGLGKRLLSMIGIDMGNQTAASENSESNMGPTPMDPATMRALQNATVLEKLNHRVSSIMGGMSKMYNSTVQEQLNMLNERFKKATENSTNPWQQRMAQQVPMFFKQMAAKVGDAQEQLNRVWRDVTQAAQGNSSVLNSTGANRPQSGPNQPFFGGAFDQFMGPEAGGFFNGPNQGGQGDFVNQMTRSLGIGGDPQQTQQQGPQQGQADMATKLREFWHVQVAPQVGMLRNQMARVWRDLTASGALAPETILRSRANANNLGSPKNGSSDSSSDLVDNILKEIDMDSSSEYSLVDPNGETSTQATPSDDKTKQGDMMAKLSPQMQNRLVDMQRDLNQLWMGLTNSLQSAIANVKKSMSPRQPGQFGPSGLEPMASSQDKQIADPKENEIDGKIKELTKLQRDADTIQQVVQQQQREAQQRQSIGDRFRGFINNVDLSGMNQLPDRIGEQFNRFGSAVGNFWNQIPERWDNFMTRQSNQDNQAMMRAAIASARSTTSTTPATTAEGS